MWRISRIRKAFLPDGKTVDRALSQSEILCNELKTKFSPTGRYDKHKVSEKDLYTIFASVRTASKEDFAACCYGTFLNYIFNHILFVFSVKIVLNIFELFVEV